MSRARARLARFIIARWYYKNTWLYVYSFPDICMYTRIVVRMTDVVSRNLEVKVSAVPEHMHSGRLLNGQLRNVVFNDTRRCRYVCIVRDVRVSIVNIRTRSVYAYRATRPRRQIQPNPSTRHRTRRSCRKYTRVHTQYFDLPYRCYWLSSVEFTIVFMGKGERGIRGPCSVRRMDVFTFY